MRVDDKLLFMKYAIPCAETLVKRGKLTEDKVNELIRKIVKNKKILDDEIDIFKIAKAHCKFLAMKSGKITIDKEIIEKYFLEIHDKVVDDRYEQMGDFDPEKCRIFSGEIISSGNEIMVRTIKGDRKYRADFCPSVEKGDFVIVHRDFIIRKISRDLEEKLNQRKKNYYKEK